MIKKLINLVNFLLITILGTFFVVVFIFYFFGKDLPSFEKLSYYKPRLVSKIYTSKWKFFRGLF